MPAAKGNQYALRSGATGRSTKRHVVPVTEAEHARHHELAHALGDRKLADVIRELLNARADEVLGGPRPERRKARKP
jgi:hypothetical protein